MRTAIPPAAAAAQDCRPLALRGRRLVAAGLALCAAASLHAPAVKAAPARPATPVATDAATAQPPAAVRERSELFGAFRRAMRASELNAAAAAARRYLARFPDDGNMHYNLACVEARRGASAQAWDALARALASPQADPRQAERDPDLVSLRADPRFTALLAVARERLRSRAEAARLVLRDGYESAELKLAPVEAERGDAAWPQVTVRLEANPGGLTLRGRVLDAQLRDRPQPWRNGNGFTVTVVIPPAAGGSGFDGDCSFGFGFGLQERTPVGAFIEQDGRIRPLNVIELAPKIRFDATGKVAFYTMHVPWSVLAPYAPPADTLLGVNVSYLSVGDDRVRRTVALALDPALAGGSARWPRYVPVSLRASDRSSPTLQGALSNAVVDDGPLGIRLAAWLPRSTAASVGVEIIDLAGRSVVASGGGVERVDAVAGINRWERVAQLSALPNGPFRVRAVFAPVGFDTLRWQTELLRLDGEWLDDARAAAAKATPADRPSLDYRLAAITAALASREPRALPSPLTTTLVETGALLQRLSRTGSVMPDSGDFLAAYRDEAGVLRPCAVRLPPGPRAARNARLLLLLTGRGGGAGGSARVLAAAMRTGDLVVAAPELPPTSAADGEETTGRPGDPVAAAAAALQWARERFPARETLLAGIDDGAEDALALSLAAPSLCDRVLLLVGRDVAPWADAAPMTLCAELRSRTNQLPYSVWEIFAPLSPAAAARSAGAGRAGSAAEVTAAMRAAGLRVETQERQGDTLSPRDSAALIQSWVGTTP